MTRPLLVLVPLLLGLPASSPADDFVENALAKPILGPRQSMEEARDFVEARLPRMPALSTAGAWQIEAARLREDVLDRVVFRGAARPWKALPSRAVPAGEIDGGPGYVIKKLRFEVVPGLWIPALLYEPTDLRGRVPVVLNVNGHDAKGMAADYKQLRCINLAKRGILALSLEWFGMGQLKGKGFSHGLINAIDLTGTSGIALHYLAMTRGIDILLSQPNADPSRIGVTGLSGGGWQTIFVSGLDPRVTLSDPVAGYSSFFTRTRHLEDLGDSEQTPCDLGTVVDYTHLTALRAPNPTLLTFNAKDNCCFAAPHALPPLLEAAGPVFRLFGREGNLRSHVNLVPGTHNYERDNREALYQMIADHWSSTAQPFNPREVPSESEIRTPEALKVDLPAENLDFRKLAIALGHGLPNHASPASAEGQARLRGIVRPFAPPASARKLGEDRSGELLVSFWTLKVGTSWTVPAVEISRGEPSKTALLISDTGRKSEAAHARALIEDGYRVVAIDPFYFGEGKVAEHDYLFALMLGTVGERPLGIEAGQVIAAARWLSARDGRPPVVATSGPRTALIGLTAAALEPKAIAGVETFTPPTSFADLLESGQEFSARPEAFCFGLFEAFEVKDIAGLVAPGAVRERK